jgi:arabinose-5-phosphate isomerase
LVGNIHSPIAKKADVVLNGSVLREADPFGFVPTSSTLVALSLGDALACTVMQARGFQKDDFVRFHPFGQLGRNLSFNVGDVMHALPDVTVISPNENLRQIVIEMTRHPLGAALVFDDDRFVGIITDGDVRRILRTCTSIEVVKASDFMTRQPVVVYMDASLDEAVRIMEDRPNQIYVLPVITRDDGRCLGLLRLHDVYQASNG